MDAGPVIAEEIKNHPAWLRLEDQLNWYDAKSAWNQTWHKRLRIVQLLLATSIPLISLIDATAIKGITAIFGAAIAVLEAIQHLYQFGSLWIQYRATAEQLKHEKFLFLSEAGPYRDLQKKEALPVLAERVEEHISTEHARWVRASDKAVEQEKRT